MKISKFKEAEKALNPPEITGGKGLAAGNKYDSVPNGSAGLYLLGLIN